MIIFEVEAVFKDCAPCENVSCPNVNKSCKSVYYDRCGCCAYCTKATGEKCGGKMNLWGSCSPTDQCVYRIGSVFNEERFGFCEDGKIIAFNNF